MAKNLEPSLRLERVALGESSPEGGGAEEEALQAIADSNRAILDELPPAMVADEVYRRHRQRNEARVRPKRASGVVLGLAAAGVASVLLFVFWNTKEEAGDAQVAMRHLDPYQGPGEERIKGEPRLMIHLQTEEGPVELSPDDETVANDRLQLSYLAAGDLFGAVFSVDGNGVLTQHYPQSGENAASLLQKGKTSLPTSYQLDDAPEFERFYFISARASFPLAPLRRAIEKKPNGVVEIADHFHLDVFPLRKVEP